MSSERYTAMREEGRIAVAALDGLDGSGKGSCVDVLAKNIADLGRKVLVIDLPQYETPWGKFLSHLLRVHDEGLPIHQKMATYAANRLEIVDPIQNQIAEIAAGNDLPIQILFDRYVTSNILTLAYYFSKDELPDPKRIIRNYYDFFRQVDGLFIHELQLDGTQVVVPQINPTRSLKSLSLDETRTFTDLHETLPVQELAALLYKAAALVDPNIRLLDQEVEIDGEKIRKEPDEIADEILKTVLVLPTAEVARVGEVQRIHIAQPVQLGQRDVAHLQSVVDDFAGLITIFERVTQR